MGIGFALTVLGEAAAALALGYGYLHEPALARWERRLLQNAFRALARQKRRLEAARLRRINRHAVYTPVRAPRGGAEETERAA